MDLDLYAVSANGRVNLGNLLSGVKYVNAEKAHDGSVILSPVNIRPASGNRNPAEELPGQAAAFEDNDPAPFN